MQSLAPRAFAIVLLAALSSCVNPNVTDCGSYVCPADLMCDPSGNGCINRDRVMRCKDAADFTPCSYEGVPNGACYHGICSPAGCGNGVVDPEELCDDGNRNNLDGCSASCDSDETCGNGVVDVAAGETCDDSDHESHDECSSLCSRETLRWAYAGGGDPLPLFGNRYPAAFDRARGKLVVAGGNVINFKFETWEWGGTGWLRAASDATFPQLRYRSAFAYDSRRRRIVMFGGRDGLASARSDTWEWDGRTWRQVITPVAPPGRHSHALAYDAARGKVVLYGGTNMNFVYQGDTFADTWEFDGATWTQVTTSTAPPAMQDHAMAFDPRRGRIVAAGEVGLWEYNGTQWYDRSSVVPPDVVLPREAGLVYDPVRQAAVLVGGHDAQAEPSTTTFEWDGTTLRTFASAPSMPLASADYDPVARRILAVAVEPGAHFAVWSREDTTWREASPPAASPPGREAHALAYDPVRDRVVLFGGHAQTDIAGAGTRAIEYGDTWEWDGTSWREVTPAAGSPPPRHGHMMAYDPVAGRVLLFGGTGVGLDAFADTWAWDGTGWTQLTSSLSPSARSDAAIATAADGSIVLFGGSDASGMPLNDTWVWSGGGWTDATPTTSPSARYGCRMARDDSGALVMFGGSGGGGTVSGTWRWDGGRWDNVTPPGDSPPSRTAFAMASDGTTVWLATGSELHDLWSWSGGEWRIHSAAGIVLPARSGSAMVEASTSSPRVLLFGGTAPALINQTYFDDTWVIANEIWTEVTPKVGVPSARVHSSMTYVASRAEVLMFGGIAAVDGTESPRGDTWRWNGGGWQRVDLASGPPARAGAAIAYDAARDRVVMFGGDGGTGPLNDVWEWDGTQWIDVTPTGSSPSPRGAAAMAYDAARRVVVLFGGYDGFDVFGDTWTWDGTTWRQLDLATSPSPRHDTSMVYDELRGRVVLFGGGVLGQGASYADTWEWDGTSWVDVTPAIGSPEPRYAHSLIYDRASRRVLLFFGVTSGLPTQLAVHAWDGQKWTVYAAENLLGTLWVEADLAYDDARRRVVAFGGIHVDLVAQRQQVSDETWLATFDSGEAEESCLFGVDGDRDGLLACDDPDCAGYCYPMCPPATSCTATPRCGDGTCDPRRETCRSCPQDCGACPVGCGDSLCESSETAAGCPGDCALP
jgi:cysteine-rich repeat protein